jgi:predicted neuraminidase
MLSMYIRSRTASRYLAGTAVLVGLALGASAPGESATQQSRSTVYEMADGVVHAAPPPLQGAREAYLPIIEPSSHASNLLALPDGDILDFWFGGTWEGNSDVSIIMSRLDHKTDVWSLPKVLASRPGWSNQNPVPFRTPTGKLLLFFTSQKAHGGETTSTIYEMTSGNDGRTWTQPKLEFPTPGSYDRQHIVVSGDEWLFPIYIAAGFGIGRNSQNDRSIVEISQNSGATWKACRIPGMGGLVQMNIVKSPPNEFLAFFRSRYADWVYESRSSDGCHWSAPVATCLPNNNASIQAVRLKDGHLVMAFNNTQADTRGGEPRSASRAILSVALSADNGKTWPWVRDVQSGPTPPEFRPGEDLEYSYPSIIQSPNGMLQMSFTFRRETIKYLSFSEDWIKHGRTAGVFNGSCRSLPGDKGRGRKSFDLSRQR